MIERPLESGPFVSDATVRTPGSTFSITFDYSIAESLHPPSEEELERVRILTPQSWPSVWNANKEQNQTDLQAPGLPRPFLRTPRRIHSDLYPLWRLQDCEWNTWSNPSEIGITDEQFEQFWRERNFRLVKEWLLALPFKREEQVYLARRPEVTLVLEWGIFVNHWDAFCPLGGFMNVVDEDPEWYLHFYYEDVAIFGCTYDYAAKKKMPLTLFEDPTEDFEMSIGYTAGGKRSVKWEKALDIYLAEVSRA